MKVEIGKVLKAQGIKGELKLACSTDDAAMLKSVKTVWIDGTEYAVQKIRADGKFAYVLPQGVSDRNTAESFRGKTVFAEKDELTVAKGRYFVDDLIGSDVCFEGGKKVGAIVDVLQYGAADVIVCSAAKPFSFPFLKDLVLSVDLLKKQMTVDEKRFQEVVCYED